MVRTWMKRIAVSIISAVLMIGMIPVVEQPEKVWAYNGSGTEDAPYEVSTWSDLYDVFQRGGYVKLTGDVKYGTGGGSYQEMALVIPDGKNVNLDLNGCVIDRGLNAPDQEGSVIKVQKNASLTLTDSQPDRTHESVAINGGIITGGYASYDGGGVYNSGGTFTMFGGTICENTANCGGGVFNEGIFNRFGGMICGNTAVNGGGVYNFGGSVTMSGGEISGNEATNAGGGVFHFGGSLSMSGGTISKNTANDWGGGVKIFAGSVTMSGGTISENAANQDGGGVYNDASFTMFGGEIIRNLSNLCGGGVYNEGSFTMSGGEISGNETTIAGGGVYNLNTFNMSGGTICGNEATNGGGVGNGNAYNMSGGTISGNTANKDGGGVYNAGSKPFTMSGGTICENTAVDGGGVYYFGDEPFTMSGGMIYGNTADIGGGVYIHNHLVTSKFNVSGGPEILGNSISGSSVQSNLYLERDVLINNIEEGLSADASIGVTVEDLPVNFASRTITSGLNKGGSVSNFFSDQDDFFVLIYSNEAALRRRSYKIAQQPSDLQIKVGAATGNALYVSAATLGADTYKLKYQWFQCSDANKSNPRAVTNEADEHGGSSFIFPTETAGTYYYFCRVRLDEETLDSKVATVKIIEEEKPHIHSYTAEVTTLPTITEPGVLTYTCSECGHTYTESIPSLMEQDYEGLSVREEAEASGKYNGKDVTVTVKSVAYNKVFYTGKKISPEKDLGAKTDISSLTSIITTNGKYTPTKLFKITYVSGNNQSARSSSAKKAPYFYAKITLDEKKAKKAGLNTKRIRELKTLIDKLNKQLKKKKCLFTIEKADISSPDVTVIVKGTIKKGKLTKVKSVKVKYSVNGKKWTLTIPKKQRTVKLLDAKAKTVTVKGKGNFTGNAVVKIG